jgi:AraC-like DNA-binding protein
MDIIKPYAEPIILPQGQTSTVEFFHYGQGNNHRCFHHFHDVCELVMFEKAEGNFISQSATFQIKDKTLVFIPSMEVHNFELTQQEKSWHILQFSPLLFSLLDLSQQHLTLSTPLVIKLSNQKFSQYKMLMQWVMKNNESEDLIKNDLLSVLIRSIAMDKSESLSKVEALPRKISPISEKLIPLLKVIQHEQRIDLNLKQAAALCKLSPSYFSRYFKSIFHQNFSQYMLVYRLHIASRYLISSNKSVSTICYELNFTHPSYFIAKFKQHFGVTPRQYRSL